jgi:hypothetical protein
MHHYGGGWADIKHTSADWRPFFDKLKKSNALALGYTELPDGIPHISGANGDELRANYRKNIGLCAFIFKKTSQITVQWYSALIKILDDKFEQLSRHPASHPQDQLGLRLPDGSASNYPITWSGILGDIFHPLMYRSNAKILQDSIQPQFFGYR